MGWERERVGLDRRSRGEGGVGWEGERVEIDRRGKGVEWG